MTDRPPSSEDLIAAAHEELRRPSAEPETPRPTEARAEHSSPAAAPARSAPEDPPIEWGQTALDAAEDAGADPFGTLDLDTRGAAGPTMPAPASAPSGFARLWARRGWVVGAVVLVGAAVSIFDNTKAVDALGPGDCFDDPGVETVYEVEGIDCTEPHDYEVFATVQLGSADSYPGDEQLFETAWDRCLGHFEPYVGTAYESSQYYLDSMIPTPDGWAAGDHEATCVLFTVDESALDIVRASTSARGSRR